MHYQLSLNSDFPWCPPGFLCPIWGFWWSQFNTFSVIVIVGSPFLLLHLEYILFFVHQLCKDPHLIAGLQYLSRKSSIHPSCGIQVEGNCCARWPKIIINLQNGEILSTCMCTHIHSFRYIYKYGYLYLVSWCMYSVWWCLKYTVDLLRLLLH